MGRLGVRGMNISEVARVSEKLSPAVVAGGIGGFGKRRLWIDVVVIVVGNNLRFMGITVL